MKFKNDIVRHDIYNVGFASRRDGECFACGRQRLCWEIDTSGGDYSGYNFCRSCLRILADALDKSE